MSGRGLRAWVNRLRGRRSESISEIIGDARKASEAMSRTVARNPEGPDADLRYAPYGH